MSNYKIIENTNKLAKNWSTLSPPDFLRLSMLFSLITHVQFYITVLQVLTRSAIALQFFYDLFFV